MSFFAKVKQFFGAGTVKVQLAVPPSVAKNGAKVPGRVTLRALSDQHVIDLTVLLEERWETGRGDAKREKTFELGKLTLASAFDVKAGEERTLEFELPFELVKSNADSLKERGGALGALGSISAFASGEKSRYRIKAECDVKGAALDPSDEQEITLN